jgi:site-specific DNA recombinase
MEDAGMIKPIFAYCRVSGRGQLDGNGFARQMEAIKRFCGEAGYHINKVYREQVSGTADENGRPKFLSMVSAILENGCNTVVVERLDRLAREYRVQESLIIFLASKGIDLIVATTAENVTEAVHGDPMKKALIQVQGVFAELDKSLLVKKLRKARDKVRAQKGRCEGPKKFGSTPEEAKILKKVRYIGCKSRPLES